jgi:outer membrane protein assembly factor BamB
MGRGGASRTGFVSEQAYPPLTLEWEFRAGADIVSSPAVFDDIVYFGSRDNKIYAFNGRTGAPLWKYLTGGWVDSSPAVSGGAVYAASLDGNLYALDRLTGAFLWRSELGAASVSSPLVADGRVYVGTGAPDNKLKVFDAVSGEQLASYAAAQPVESAPSADRVRVYFGANDGRLYALNKETLAQVWTYQTMGGRYGMNAVAVSSGIVYAVPGFDEDKPLAFNASDGALLNPGSAPFEAAVAQGAEYGVRWAQAGSPAVSADKLYFSGGFAANTLFAAESAPAGGALAYIWTSSPALGGVSPTGLLSSPAMANEIIYTGTVGGFLTAFSSGAVSIVLAADVAFSSPVYSSPGISNGMVYIGSSGGLFRAYKAAKITSFSNIQDGAVVNGTVTVKGYLSNPGLAGYSLDYSTGGIPAVWHNIVSSVTTAAVENGSLGSWDTTSLENGEYLLRLTALEEPLTAGMNTASARVRVNFAPPPPSALSAADVPGDAGNRILLGWSASPASGLTAYRIYRSAGGAPVLLGSTGPAVSAWTDSAAATGSTFTYTVRAFDGYVESSDSNQASAFSANDTGDFTPPSKITDLAAVSGPLPGMVQLSWSAPGNDGSVGTASHYVIKYASVAGYDWSGFDGAALPVSTRGVEGPYGALEAEDIRGLFGGVTYYFALKAYDSAGNTGPLSDTAAAWAATDPEPPGPPSNLTAADTPGDAGGSVTLAWDLSPDDGGGAGDVYGYRIFRRTLNTAYAAGAPYASVPAGTGSYTDTAATENIRYYYSAAAFDSTNNSTLSNEAWGVSADNWRFFDAGRGVSVRLADGARVDIPANAASQNDNIMVIKLDPDLYQPLYTQEALGAANPTGIVYEIKFRNPATRLLKPALLSIPYTAAEVAGMSLENLRLYTLAGGKWVMVDTSRPDAQAMIVTAEVSHFSVYSVMEYAPSGALFSRNEVYTYPNPARGDTVTFKFRVSEKSGVKIDVYNVAGEKVARLERTGCPAGVSSEIVWHVENIASGVYQYRLEADSASGTKSVIKRLAIIH